MKKTILLVAVAALCASTQAKILRVNNTAGAGAPYSTVNDALEAAENGDTIMLDGSSTSYGDFTVNKKLVIMGPGYWRTENGLVSEGTPVANTGLITVNSGGKATAFRGLWVDNFYIMASDVVINRCHTGNIVWQSGADRLVVHQNYIDGHLYGVSSEVCNYAQVTNNIIEITSWGNSDAITNLNQSYIAYNTVPWLNINGEHLISGCTALTVEKNIVVGNMGSTDATTGNFVDNYVYGSRNKPIYTNRSTDKTIRDQKIDDEAMATAMAGKGAFCGDDPYVISGIPAGPTIEDVTVPASVEQGQTLNITIKLGVQK